MLFYHQNAVSIHQTFDDQKDLSTYLGFPALVFQIFVAQKDKNSNTCVLLTSQVFYFNLKSNLYKVFNIKYCYK